VKLREIKQLNYRGYNSISTIDTINLNDFEYGKNQ
jgi:hypothetical protein